MEIIIIIKNIQIALAARITNLHCDEVGDYRVLETYKYVLTENNKGEGSTQVPLFHHITV